MTEILSPHFPVHRVQDSGNRNKPREGVQEDPCNHFGELVHYAVIELKRSPESFRQCLMHDPSVKECWSQLRLSGLSPVLQGGAKVIARPHQYEAIINDIVSYGVCFQLTDVTMGRKLKPRHIIITEEYWHIVRAALQRIRSSENVKPRRLALGTACCAELVAV